LKLFETFLDKRNKKRLLQNKILIEEKKNDKKQEKKISDNIEALKYDEEKKKK